MQIASRKKFEKEVRKTPERSRIFNGLANTGTLTGSTPRRTRHAAEVISTGHRGTMSKKGRTGKSKKASRREGAPASVRPSDAMAALKVTTPMKVLTPVEFTRDVDSPHANAVVEHDHEAGFFADVRPPMPSQDHAEEYDSRPSKMTPAARARRELFTKYVKGTVALLMALCIVALLRAATSHGHADDTPAANAQTPQIVAANVQAAPAPTQLDLARVPPPLPAAVAADKAAADEEKAAKAADPAPAKANEAPAEAPVAAATADATKSEEPKAEAPKSDKTAGQEKAAARRALESGRAGAAIEAGERSVALDPSDGEAWLLLGAAYQEKGKPGEARRCFNACLKQGKKGPIGECRQMLQ